MVKVSVPPSPIRSSLIDTAIEAVAAPAGNVMVPLAVPVAMVKSDELAPLTT